MSFKTIEWKDNSVIMIDQRKLPISEEYIKCTNYQEVIKAIKDMVIRGAPAIGVASAMGLALGAMNIEAKNFDQFIIEFNKIANEIGNARPTAVNLFWAIDRIKKICINSKDKTIEKLKEEIKEEAIKIYKEDIEINKAIGENGEKFIKDKDTILTHCNTGSLATASYGTALGVIRSAVLKGKKVHVFVDETRPFLQGARLTAWELLKDNIPFTLITDNMAGNFMKKGFINLVMVGADRIAKNGDTANKIGTYSIAVLAKYHNIPFYVCAPTSTIDINLNSGEEIPIEERNPTEVTHILGKQIAPSGCNVRNPAFDVTPNSLITAIITEKEVITPPYEKNIEEILNA